MIRMFLATLVVMVGAASSQAALLAGYNFNSGFAASYTDSDISATSITGTGFTNTSQTLQWGANANGSYNNPASLTLSSVKFFSVQKVSFDLIKWGNQFAQVQAQVTVGGTSLTPAATTGVAATPSTFARTADFTVGGPLGGIGATYNNVTSRYELVISIARRSGGGSASPALDNLQIEGIVPEPASMAVFGGLGLVGMAYRRRMKKAVSA